ncbi:Response regulator DrrA [Candidatus Omnitrophus magneticus]|uniref:Response regulator DrrA n=1 Tax=Candidatus Omnitrophus magneticus TaxID=1609969 RepID=A0A0F0CQT3_9BACT|nr:Response regulator DrrA [Candidatus Omnitrophus magneticus]
MNKMPNKKILMLSHDKELFSCLGAYIGWAGYNVEYAFNIHDGLSKIKSETYDLFVFDEFLDNTPSEELIDKTRSDTSVISHNKEIIFTSYEFPEKDKYNFLKKENIHFINKYESIDAWLKKIEIIFR